MKKLKFTLSSIVIALVAIFGMIIVPNVRADENIVKVKPGKGTLKRAVENASSGDTLKLEKGEYLAGDESDKTVYITKKIKIEGVQGNSASPTIIDVPIVVETSDKVVISNFTSGSQTVEPNFKFIKTIGKVDLDINNVRIWGIMRGDSTGKFPLHDAMALDITSKSDDVTGKNDDSDEKSIINVKNSSFEKPGIHYGINVEASNTKINIDNTKISGRAAAKIESGKHNSISISNKSEIMGPSPIYKDTEAFIIKDQQDLLINIDNSTIVGSTVSGNLPIKLFSFSDEKAKSTDVNINITNGSKIYIQDKENEGGVIFNFRSDSVALDNNVVNIDSTSKIYLSILDANYKEISQEQVPVSRKYSTVDNGSVVGIYDRFGNGEIRIYDNQSQIKKLTDKEYTEKDGYNFKGWFKNFDGTNYTDEFKKSEGSYPNTVSGINMDLYPKFSKILKLTVKNVPNDNAVKDKFYEIEEGQTINESSSKDEIKADLEKIKTKEGQVFRKYIISGESGSKEYTSSQEEELINSLKIMEDSSIEAIHEVEVVINGKVFSLPVNGKLEDLESQADEIDALLEALKNEVLNNGYNFKQFVDSDGNKFTKQTKITKNTTISAQYNIKVTINGVNGAKEFFIDSGKNLTDVKNYDVDSFDEVKKKDNREFLYFVANDDNSTIIKNDDTTYKFTKNTILTPVFGVTVTIDKNDYTLAEGTQLSSDSTIIEALKGLEKEEKRLVEYRDGNGNVIATVDEVDRKTDKVINDNIVINPKYVIDIEIVADETYKVAVDENTKLQDVEYQRPQNFRRFVDYETEEEVPLDTVLKKHTKLKVIYGVKVTINNHQYELDTFQKFDDLFKNSDAKKDLDKLKEVPDTKKNFSKFVYIDSNTNQEIELKNDTVITSDITVLPKYTIEITIVYKNSLEQKEEIIKLELDEGQSISNLSEDEIAELNSKLGEIEGLLNKDSEDTIKFSKFLGLDGAEVDIKNTKFDNNITIEAIFEKKENSTPIEPSEPEDVTKPDNENNGNSDNNHNTNNNGNLNDKDANGYPLKESAPNTGVDESRGSLLVVIALILSGFYSPIKFVVKKINN